MKASLFIPAHPFSEEDRVALERRRDAQRAERNEAKAEERLFVSFFLKGTLYALDAGVVREALTRLGNVAKIAQPGVELGLALSGNTPVVVVDLHAHLGRPRDVEALAAAPALHLRLPELSVALAVDAPLEFVEAKVTHRAGAEGDDATTGRLSNGALWLSSEWLERWVREQAGGVDG